MKMQIKLEIDGVEYFANSDFGPEEPSVERLVLCINHLSKAAMRTYFKVKKINEEEFFKFHFLEHFTLQTRKWTTNDFIKYYHDYKENDVDKAFAEQEKANKHLGSNGRCVVIDLGLIGGRYCLMLEESAHSIGLRGAIKK